MKISLDDDSKQVNHDFDKLTNRLYLNRGFSYETTFN